MSAERKKLDEDLLELWSLIVRVRDKHCRNCGSAGERDAHHLIPRSWHLGRYNLNNGIALCRFPCHAMEKSKPKKFDAMILRIMGHDYMENLIWDITKEHKWTESDLRWIKKELQRELKNIGGTI